MARISDERIPVRKPTGKGSKFQLVLVLKHNLLRVGNFDHAVVVLIGNENIPIRELLGTIGVVEQTGCWAAILEDDFLGNSVDLDDALIGLVDDQDIVIRQLDCK